MSSVGYRSEGPVATIRISRPERRNALDHAALVELHNAVRRAREDNLRALVLTGDDGHFCAGADLTELEDLRFTEQLRSTLDDLASLPFPTISAIAGSCMGLGMQLAISTDLRIATPDARFAVPVARLGLMVDETTIRRLSTCLGHSTARWMLLSADVADTEAMAGCGFVQKVVHTTTDEESGAHVDPGEAVVEEAHRLAGSIAELAPLSLAGSKLGFDLLLADPAAQGSPGGSDAYRKAFERAWASADLVEGRHAFRERRNPEFRGR